VGPKPWRSSRTWQSLKPAARPQPNDIPAWWLLCCAPVLRLRLARLTCTADLSYCPRPPGRALPRASISWGHSPGQPLGDVPERPADALTARCRDRGLWAGPCQGSFFVNLPRLYSWRRRKPDMAINGRRNKPIGPGGSTRRLHHRGVSGQKPKIGRVLLMAGH
jgi:hypothetical protein